MKDLAKILLYLAAIVVLGILLAPPLFKFGRSYGETHQIRVLATSGFERYFTRAVQISALLLLWPLAKSLRVRGIADFGLRRDPRRFQHLSFGLVSSLCVMSLLAVSLLVPKVYVLLSPVPFGRLGPVLITAGVVSVMEELLFRGVLLGLLRRNLQGWFPLVFVSALYSTVHFLRPPSTSIAPASVNFLSAFTVLGDVFWRFAQPMQLASGFAVLFVLGLILGYATIRTRSLWLAIGLHAGCIIGKFGFGKIARRVADAGPWFGDDIATGIAPVFLISMLGIGVWAWLNRRDASVAENRV